MSRWTLSLARNVRDLAPTIQMKALEWRNTGFCTIGMSSEEATSAHCIVPDDVSSPPSQFAHYKKTHLSGPKHACLAVARSCVQSLRKFSICNRSLI